MILAMHMANELLSLPVAAVTIALAGGFLAVAAWRTRQTVGPEKLPLMGVLGAFVFAGQMINFTLPGMPATSGHLGGAVLLTIVLGPWAAMLTMAAILIVQCLLFQDGGLLALGANILNLGVWPSLIGWGGYRLFGADGRKASALRIYLGSWAACLAGVTFGAAMVPAQAALSGVLRIDPIDFLAVMVGVHLIIGFIEGLITFSVVAYLRQVRPSVLGLSVDSAGPDRLSGKALAGTLMVSAMLLAGLVSWFASSHPDGLEWSYQNHQYEQADRAVSAPSEAMAQADEIGASIAPMPDYALETTSADQDGDASQGNWPAVDGWSSLAGLIGTAATLGLIYLTALLLRRRKAQCQPVSVD